jgi:hypothetical protein
MAYDTLLIAEEINHVVTLHLGAMAGSYSNEDAYLMAMLKWVKATRRSAGEFIEEWNIEEEVSKESLTTGMKRLVDHINATLATNIFARKGPHWS